MAKKVKIITKDLVYKGYLQLYKFDLQIPSMAEDDKCIGAKKREVVHNPDSILVLIYAPMIDSFVMGKEFRPGVFFNETQDDPFILECVSGTIDEDKTPEEIAKKEVYEEAGLEVTTLKLIACAYKSPGIMTEKTWIYYTEVPGSPQSGLHGVGDEEIMTQIIRREKVYELIDQLKINDAATLIALNWFRAIKG